MYGPDFVPEKPNVYKTKSDCAGRPRSNSPDVDAIRPESVRPHLTPDQYYLYKLIWNRFVASQMRRRRSTKTTVDINAADYVFRVKGSVPKFAGWLRSTTWDGRSEDRRSGSRCRHGRGRGREQRAAAMREGDTLQLRELKPNRSSRSLRRATAKHVVKALEENGIGRPSTYASIISVIQARDYVNKIEGRFKPTVLGRMLVDRLLSPAFDDILDVEYTRNLEEDLDKIEEGTSNYAKTLGSFYKKFEEGSESAPRRR